jgi:hypothetical protein
MLGLFAGREGTIDADKLAALRQEYTLNVKAISCPFLKHDTERRLRLIAHL